MSGRLIVRPETEADISDAAMWYDSREPGFGLELVLEVQSAIARAMKNPESFTAVRVIQRSDVFSLAGFLIVFSSSIDTTLVVFAVLHASRHDRIWKHRARAE